MLYQNWGRRYRNCGFIQKCKLTWACGRYFKRKKSRRWQWKTREKATGDFSLKPGPWMEIPAYEWSQRSLPSLFSEETGRLWAPTPLEILTDEPQKLVSQGQQLPLLLPSKSCTSHRIQVEIRNSNPESNVKGILGKVVPASDRTDAGGAEPPSTQTIVLYRRLAFPITFSFFFDRKMSHILNNVPQIITY